MAASVSATGLTSDEARRRLAAYGTNAVQDVVQHPITLTLRRLWAPVPWMLEAAVLLQLALGGGKCGALETSRLHAFRSRGKDV
jgi:H+-transporting ATPase